MMGGTASERSSGHCARLWTSVGHWRDGKNLERHTSDVGAHMAPLGVETAGRACYSINNTTFAMYSERDSLRRPWAHVGRSARSARIGSVAMGGVCLTGETRVGKGLILYLHAPDSKSERNGKVSGNRGELFSAQLHSQPQRR